jgi:hypothetical protein
MMENWEKSDIARPRDNLAKQILWKMVTPGIETGTLEPLIEYYDHWLTATDYEMNLDAKSRLRTRQNSPQPGLEPGNPAFKTGVMTIKLLRSMVRTVL